MKHLAILFFLTIALTSNAQHAVVANGKYVKSGGHLAVVGGDSGGGYPIVGLSYRYTQSAEGTDLIDQFGNGTDIPYITGSGADQIFNFGVLSDARFDKSNITYWGDSLNNWFYYDQSNPTYFKLSDFHYREFQYQMNYKDNFVFAKINYSAEVLQSVDEVLIYANPLSDPGQARTYIGINDWNNKSGFYYYENEWTDQTDVIDFITKEGSSTIFFGSSLFSDITLTSGNVETVRSASGGTDSITQSDPTHRPIYNEKTGFEFSVNYDFLELTGLNLTGDFTIQSVINNRTTASGIYYVIGVNNTASGVVVEYNSNADSWGTVGIGGNVIAGENLNENQEYILTIVRRGSNIYLYNSSDLINSGAVTPLTITDIKFGIRGDESPTISLDGFLNNMIVLDYACDTAQVQDLVNFSYGINKDLSASLLFTSDQSSIDQDVYKLTLPEGSRANINFGEGYNYPVYGSTSERTLTSYYVNTGTYPVIISGDVLEIDTFNVDNQDNLTINMSDWDGMTDISKVSFTGTELTGDITGFFNNNDSLVEINYVHLPIDSASVVEGSINGLKDNVKLKKLNLQRIPEITGTITDWELDSLYYIDFYDSYVTWITDSLPNLPALTTIQLRSNDGGSGDISYFSNFTNATSVKINTQTSLTGDLSVIDNFTDLVTFKGYENETFTYTSTTFPVWSNLVDIQIHSCGLSSTEVDQFLIDLAASSPSGALIKIDGTNAARTSASDAAVTTLEGNSNTVEVNE